LPSLLVASAMPGHSEIATVPGTVDLVELLFSAVLMLVDWLVGSVSRSREARLWELLEFFRRSVSVEKVCWAYFSSRKRSLAERPAEEGREGQEPRGTRRVEDLNRGDRAPWKRAPDPVGGRYPTREELLHPEAVGA